MAEIVPYRDQITPELGPNTGTDALISSARRVGPLEREAGLAVSQGTASIASAAKEILGQREKVAAQQEIAGGIESHALLQGQHEADLNQLLSNPDNLKDINGTLAKFQHDTLDPETADWVSKFQTQAGQEWAAIHGAQQGAELLKHGRSMSSLISADNAAVAVAKGADQYAANAIANPQSTEMQIKAALSGIDALAKTIDDPVKRAEFMKLGPHIASQIAYAGAHAATNVNPQLGLALGKQLAQYMNPEHQTALQGYADTSTRANRQQAQADEMMARRQDTEAYGRALTDWTMHSLYDSKGNPAPASDAMQKLLQISSMRGAALEPTLARAAVDEFQRVKLELAAGKDTVDNRQVKDDLYERLGYSPDDPRFPTELEVGRARGSGDLSAPTAQNLRETIKGAETNPGLTAAMRDFNDFIKEQAPPNTGYTNGSSDVNQDRNNFFTYKDEQRTKFNNGIRAGIPSTDLLSPKSPNFIGFMTPAQQSSTAVNPAQAANPASQQQAQASTAADLAVAVANLVKNNSIDSARDLLQKSGLDVPVNMGEGAWCAPLINTVLKAVHLPPAAENTAESFKAWGNPIDVNQVQKGDIFYMPAEGYTGHVGIVLDSNLRAGPHGEPQVQVVSSHLKGDPSNPGGVEWRDTGPMIFRRAKPPQADIKPKQASSPSWWDQMVRGAGQVPAAGQ